MSALEHAIPERFFNDPAKCNTEGTTTPVIGLPACPQGISAVKAIGLAAAQGQKIYTITQEVYRNNPNIVNSNLSALSYSTKQGIQNALDAGNDVTTHERPIAQSGWTGAGYTFTDPSTGAGGYIIDGGSNGGWFNFIGSLLIAFLVEEIALFGFALGSPILSAASTLLGLGYAGFGPKQDSLKGYYSALFQFSLSLLFLALLGNPAGLLVGVVINSLVLLYKLYRALVSRIENETKVFLA